MHVWIGAMMVGSICMTKFEGDDIKRGDETGEWPRALSLLP
jgi:hypothetical protein